MVTANTATNVQEALHSEAYIEGRRVGLQGLSSSLVKGRPGSTEHAEGILGWKSGNDQLAYEDAMWCHA